MKDCWLVGNYVLLKIGLTYPTKNNDFFNVFLLKVKKLVLFLENHVHYVVRRQNM